MRSPGECLFCQVAAPAARLPAATQGEAAQLQHAHTSQRPTNAVNRALMLCSIRLLSGRPTPPPSLLRVQQPAARPALHAVHGQRGAKHQRLAILPHYCAHPL